MGQIYSIFHLDNFLADITIRIKIRDSLGEIRMKTTLEQHRNVARALRDNGFYATVNCLATGWRPGVSGFWPWHLHHNIRNSPKAHQTAYVIGLGHPSLRQSYTIEEYEPDLARDLERLRETGTLSQRHGTSSGCRWRRRPPDMAASCESSHYIAKVQFKYYRALSWFQTLRKRAEGWCSNRPSVGSFSRNIHFESTPGY